MSQLRVAYNIGSNAQFTPPPVDILLDDKVIAYNLFYSNVTSYIPTSAGNHVLAIRDTTTRTNLSSSPINLNAGYKYTSVVIGDLSNLQGTKIIINRDTETNFCPQNGNGIVRFTQGTTTGTYDIYNNGELLFENVSSGQATDFKLIKSGNNSISVITSGTTGSGNVIATPNILSGGKYDIILTNNVNGMSTINIADVDPRCQNIQPNFNTNAFMGRWFVIASIPTSGQSNCSRRTVVSTSLHDMVRITLDCYDQDWSKLGSETYFTPYTCTPGLFSLTSVTGSGEIVGDFVIHSTDYVDYALVGTANRSQFSIYSRTPRMTVDHYQELLAEAKSLGYDTNRVVIYYHALIRNKPGENRPPKPLPQLEEEREEKWRKTKNSSRKSSSKYEEYPNEQDAEWEEFDLNDHV